MRRLVDSTPASLFDRECILLSVVEETSMYVRFSLFGEELMSMSYIQIKNLHHISEFACDDGPKDSIEIADIVNFSTGNLLNAKRISRKTTCMFNIIELRTPDF